MRSHRRHSGFTFTVALFLLAFAGVAMSVVGLLMRTDLRRTSDELADAQLRQLLLAAAVDVPAHLKPGQAVKYDIALPPGVEAKLIVEANNGDVKLRAEMEGRSETELLQYTSDETGWRLLSAELERPVHAR